jgi:hypothetical protein
LLRLSKLRSEKTMVTTAWLGRAPITGEKRWPATRVSAGRKIRQRRKNFGARVRRGI